MKFVLALLFALLCSSSAWAQGNQCRTATVGASTPNCASEAFVTESIGAIPAGVASIGGLTGAVGLGSGLGTSGNNIIETPSLIGEIKIYPNTPGHLPANYLVANGAAKSRTTFSALFGVLVQIATVTFSNGSAVIGWSGNTLSAGDKIKFFTSGSLPTNFTAGTHGYNVGTEYCVLSTGLSTTQFEVGSSCGGSAIVAGSAGSGTQTAVNAPWGDGDGSATFTLPNLVGDFMRFWQDGTGSIDANRQFGAEQLDAFQGHAHTVAANNTANGGSSAVASTNAPANQGFAGAAQGGAGITNDGTNGVPRVSTETRPRNMPLLPIIRYQ